MPLDVDALRARFPALARKVDGRPAVYLDAPGGTQVPDQVIEAVAQAMARSVSNVGGGFAASRDSEEVVAEARRAAADLLGGSPDEIAFGPNMTTLTFSFSRALAREWGPGDRVVVTRLDHDANVTPWVMAAHDRGAGVAVADIEPGDVSLDMAHLESLVDERTRLVAVTGCSNAFGTLVDVARVADIAHSVGALCFVDAVHLAPHFRIDAPASGVDALVCSAYKLFGPHVGLLWTREALLERLEPYKVRPAPDRPPGKLETGTPSFPLLAGLSAAVDYLASVAGADGDRRERLDRSYEEMATREAMLGRLLLSSLPATVRVWGRPGMEGRAPTFAVSVEGHAPAEVARRLAEQGIFVWAGHYYAVEPMARLGLLEGGGLVRVGIVHTTTEGEIERLVQALRAL